jgi:hypothetical protein
MARRQRTAFQEISYGVPVMVIAKFCEVSESVAEKYKTGRAAPSRAATRLFELYIAGRIVPEEWEGFHFHSGKLWDPHGRELTHGQLRAYEIGLQLLREFARGSQERMVLVDNLFKVAAPPVGRLKAVLPAITPAVELKPEPRRNAQVHHEILPLRRKARSRDAGTIGYTHPKE